MKIFMKVLAILAVSACSQKSLDDAITSGSIYFYKASCQVQTASLSNSFCVEYGTEYSNDSLSDCTNQQSYYRGLSYDVDLINYSSGESSPECPKQNFSGMCTLSNHRIFYYKTAFTVGEAQTECNTLEGEFR